MYLVPELVGVAGKVATDLLRVSMLWAEALCFLVLVEDEPHVGRQLSPGRDVGTQTRADN